MKNKIGVWSFMVGLVLAIIISVLGSGGVPGFAVVMLAMIGVIVGLLNISDKEVQLFLVASIGFLISFQALGAVFSVLTLGWAAVSTFFYLMAIFVAPATAIVAVKALYNISKD
jgi:hypothetical protein